MAEGDVLPSVWFSCSLTSLEDRRGAVAPCVRLPLGVRGGPAACVVSRSARAYRARGSSNSRCLRPILRGRSGRGGSAQPGTIKDFGFATPWMNLQADGCFTGSSPGPASDGGETPSSWQEARGTTSLLLQGTEGIFCVSCPDGSSSRDGDVLQERDRHQRLSGLGQNWGRRAARGLLLQLPPHQGLAEPRVRGGERPRAVRGSAPALPALCAEASAMEVRHAAGARENRSGQQPRLAQMPAQELAGQQGIPLAQSLASRAWPKRRAALQPELTAGTATPAASIPSLNALAPAQRALTHHAGAEREHCGGAALGTPVAAH